MKTRSLHWTIETVVRRKLRINPQPQYQRTPVWSEAKRQLLIDSILRQYDMPKFYLRESNPPYDHEVVDGQQRLRAIWDFYEGRYVLGDTSKDIPDFGDLSGKKFSELPSDTQDRIGLFDLNLVEVEDASDLEIRDLFLRLQEGVALNPVEKRNAMPGNMRNFIADLGENQRVFPLTSISEKRFEWHDLTAIVTCLEMAEGPTDVKAYSLRKMYSDNKDFGSSGPIAKKVKRHLAYMAKVLKNRPPEMGIKWGFVDLYLLISKMDESYVIRRREEDFADFYVAFEKERREVMPDHSDLLSPSRNSWDRDLYDYIEAFIRSGGVRQNIEKRHEVYKRRFIRDTQGLMSKDLQRAFTNDERIVIWRRANETCQICRNKIEFDQMEADHIIPHSKGGQTTIDNGQALCKQCNASKGAA